MYRTADIRSTIKRLGIGARSVQLFGVDYLHLILPRGGDLFLTDYGVPHLEQLLPTNWNDKAYYDRPENANLKVGLPGSSHPYRVKTKPVRGHSLDVVVKWCRVGQDVIFEDLRSPETSAAHSDLRLAWNGPFEEFGLLMELRKTNRLYPTTIRTQKPLAIYSPPEKVKLWQTGRRKYMFSAQNKLMLQAQDQVPVEEALELDIHRLYAMIYGWVEGIDAAQAMETHKEDREALLELVKEVHYKELATRGYTVVDAKADHLIVRYRNGQLLREQNGRIAYALIDFELLQRTHDFAERYQIAQRKRYWHLLKNQNVKATRAIAGVHHTRIFGIDYIHGETSNQGKLWVIGSNAELFEYFDPSRWRTSPRIQLSNVTYRTKTLDNIKLVYRKSHVGMKPQDDPVDRRARRAQRFGYNSPFEEVAIAMELRKIGIDTVLPRAIYRTSHQSEPAEWLKDDSRFISHESYKTYDGEPILLPNYDYYLLFGYWQGSDPTFFADSLDGIGPVDITIGRQAGLIPEDVYREILENTRARLQSIGFKEELLEDRLLLRFENGSVVKDKTGRPEITICINGYRTVENGLLTWKEYRAMENAIRKKMRKAGYEDLRLKGDHLLLSMSPDGELARREDGSLLSILCNFALIRAPWMQYL
ncbi:MAG: hypothetical protein N3D11_10365 [Candidatus Sumerlaeia bacterium]|nr:hypothetical protein [Candidatus Sumerlaeia bacterium]